MSSDLATPVVWADGQYDACPDETARHADAAILGEAEPVWPQVMADLRRNGLQTRYDARGLGFDFRESPNACAGSPNRTSAWRATRSCCCSPKTPAEIAAGAGLGFPELQPCVGVSTAWPRVGNLSGQ